MKFDVIYIPCYRRDYRLTRILVANIRHWYPQIPIVLIKDLMMRDFDTSELERHFNVSVFPQLARLYGWGFSKFEVFMEESGKRFLMLDSDIILAGPILDQLEKYDEDWVVHDEPFTQEDLLRYYFDPAKIKKLDPEFDFPNYTFNSGQLVGTTGSLKHSDFDKYIEWSEPRIQRFRDAFTFGGEQPLLNYLLMKKAQTKQLTVRRVDFMRAGQEADTTAVSIDRIMKKDGYPFIIHWHDKKPQVFLPSMRKIPRHDILLHFERMYYHGCGIGATGQFFRTWYEYIEDRIFMNSIGIISKAGWLKKLLKKLKG